MRVSGSYPNLVNGVSQQAEAQRLASQAAAIDNGLCSIVAGVHKRPPTNHLKRLTTGSWTNGAIHTINRDLSEQYIVAISGGDLRVFDLNGNEKTVAFPNGKAYLTVAGKAQESIRFLSIADYTFVVNREKTVAMDPATTTAWVPRGLIWIKTGVVGHKYRVEIDGVQKAEFTQASGLVETTAVATALVTALNTSLGTTDWSIASVANVLTIERKDKADFQFHCTDTYGNTAMSGIKDKIQRYSELPAEALPGMLVCVAGDVESSRDDYWVRFVAGKAGTTTICPGTWEETAAPGITYKLDRTTMPHVLVRESDGTFTFRQGEWEDRTVGDDLTCRKPSFVGQKLGDVFAFRNRLGFLWGETVVLSEVSAWFNFFRTTAVTLLDDAPIDVTVGGTNVARLDAAVPYLNKLILFSDQSQFTLESGQDILSSKSVTITQTTRFDGMPNVRPVNAGNSVFFAFPRGDFSGVREYFLQGNMDQADATDVTAHVPRYIAGNLTHLTVSTTEECLVGVSDDGSNLLYVYQYKWAGDQKVQSAWSRWVLDAQPIMAEFLADDLYLLLQRPDGVYLEKVEMAKTLDTGVDYLVHLDRRVLVGIAGTSYDPVNNRTWFTIPYDQPEVCVVTAEGSNDLLYPPGLNLKVMGRRPNGTGFDVYVLGDHHQTPVWVGVPYTFSYTFTPPYLKQEATGGGLVAMNEGRLQVSSMSVRYDHTGQFSVTVSPDRGRSCFTSKFTGRIVGSNNNVLGTLSLESGSFVFPVRCRNEDVLVTLTNDSFLPSFFLSAEWSAEYIPKSRRV